MAELQVFQLTELLDALTPEEQEVRDFNLHRALNSGNPETLDLEETNLRADASIERWGLRPRLNSLLDRASRESSLESSSDGGIRIGGASPTLDTKPCPQELEPAKAANGPAYSRLQSSVPHLSSPTRNDWAANLPMRPLSAGLRDCGTMEMDEKDLALRAATPKGDTEYDGRFHMLDHETGGGIGILDYGTTSQGTEAVRLRPATPSSCKPLGMHPLELSIQSTSMPELDEEHEKAAATIAQDANPPSMLNLVQCIKSITRGMEDILSQKPTTMLTTMPTSKPASNAAINAATRPAAKPAIDPASKPRKRGRTLSDESIAYTHSKRQPKFRSRSGILSVPASGPQEMGLSRSDVEGSGHTFGQSVQTGMGSHEATLSTKAAATVAQDDGAGLASLGSHRKWIRSRPHKTQVRRRGEAREPSQDQQHNDDQDSDDHVIHTSVSECHAGKSDFEWTPKLSEANVKGLSMSEMSGFCQSPRAYYSCCCCPFLEFMIPGFRMKRGLASEANEFA
ncbi:hypothetical protein CC78DRAFT_567220 [Lojkania enalia]|uniref:Uncharacterized protein n=1 Tax=Lojkania enalia TaxID=147567 RepID=A0A9P4N780_9PLEO|nr:hypothetical protein CC78DRAFT_567220 [Didymosphaeria enalia]